MEEIKNYWKLLKCGTKTMFKEFFKKETNKKQRANMWTFSRLIISFIIPILTIISIISSLPILFTSAFIVTGVGALTDFFDGRSARKHNSYSEYGKFLDQLADKSFAGMIGISLSFLNPLFIINIIGELSIFLTNIIYKIKCSELTIKSTMIGRIKEWPLFSTLALGFLSINIPVISNIVNISIITTLLFQVATIASYVKENEEEIKTLNNKKKIEKIQFIDEIKDECENKLLEKDYSDINKGNEDSKKEQLIKLKNLLNEIKDIKYTEEIKKTYQKK